jgi:oligoribonuclease NrnB/cAMP/cGMP phosphodiesterase (DHH superfamily)
MFKRNLVVYHRVDYDGIFSCLIAKKAMENKGLQVETLGWNYRETLPDIDHLLQRYATITLVDISFPPELMLKLRESSRVIWIDHHITALEDSAKQGYQDLPGIRETGTAACELTWTYFNPHSNAAPMIIQLAGAYDVWNKTRFDWDRDVLPLQYGLKGRYGTNKEAIEKDWDILVEIDAYLNVVDEGQVILEFLKKQWSGWMKNAAFPVTVAGKYKGVAIISPMFSSNSFESVSLK